MKVPSSRQQKLDRMDQSYKQEVTKKEKNLKNIKYKYNKRIKDIKYDGNKLIENHQVSERKRAVKEITAENKRWDHLQNKLNEKKKLWENELSFLKSKQKGEVDLLQERHLERLESETYNLNKELKELEGRAQNSMLDLKESTREELAKEKADSQYKKFSLKRQDESLEDQVIRDYSSFNQRQQRDIDHALRRKQEKQKEIIRDLTNKNYEEIKAGQENQKINIETLNDIHNETLKDREEILKEKIGSMELEHQGVLNRIKTKNEGEINELKNDYAKRKDFIDSRSKDPFYRLETFKPRIVDRDNEYLLKIEIPEHEARFVNLTGKERKLRLTSSRRFEDLAKGEDGALNRSARSEMISQEYLLDNHINPRKITQVYENGELIFKVPKY